MAPRTPKAIEHYITEMPNVAISVDVEAFNEAIRNNGVRLVHYSAMRCPVGMTDLDDNRRPHKDHAGCSNGFIYTRMGCITATLMGNDNQPQLREIGFVDGASFTATFPQTYDDGTQQFYMAPFDRFYLDEEALLVPTWQLVRANESGMDRLNFPAVEVERLMDWREQLYECGKDFTIEKGQIVWVRGGERPVPDLDSTEQAAVYSIRYRYRPFFYVARMLHELRISQVDDFLSNTRKLVRLPQQALLHREFLFLNESQDDQAVDPRSPRQTQAPPSGGFGPR